MKLTNTGKAIAYSAPCLLGFLILAYVYCCPGLARIPNVWNLIFGRYLFLACLLGGTVTAILGLTFLQSKWEEFDPVFKTMAATVNLAWLGMVVFIVIGMHVHH